MATWLAFDVSATRREPARASRNRSGSRHSSTSGAGPERENLYDVWSMTIAIVPCFSSAVAAASALARSLYAARATNGLSVVATHAAPSSLARWLASAAPANGPTVTSAPDDGAAVTFI